MLLACGYTAPDFVEEILEEDQGTQKASLNDAPGASGKRRAT
jgi:hypothetical protein